MSDAKRRRPAAAKAAPRIVRGARGASGAELDPAWQRCRSVFDRTAEGYGFSRVDLPAFELATLYRRAWGGDDPAVAELATVTRGDEELTLPASGRESLCRLLLERAAGEQPAGKFSYWTPTFVGGAAAQQSWQYGIELYGEPDPTADAQCAIVAWRLAQSLRVGATLHLNSFGCATCRPPYLKALGEFFRRQRGAPAGKQPWRALADLSAEEAAAAPQTVDFLCPSCNAHLVQVLEYLDEVEVPYALDPTTVAPFDYASRTVFTVTPPEASTPLLFGCRYDELCTRLGGSGSAVGFGGDVAALAQQAAAGTGSRHAPHVLLAQLGPEARKHAIVLFERLRAANITVAAHLGGGGLKGQLEEAGRLGVRYAAIIGQREILDGTVLLRDMENGIQETVTRERLAAEIAKRLAREAALPLA